MNAKLTVVGLVGFFTSLSFAPVAYGAEAGSSDKFAQVRGFKVDLVERSDDRLVQPPNHTPSSLAVLNLEVDNGRDALIDHHQQTRTVEIRLQGAITQTRKSIQAQAPVGSHHMLRIVPVVIEKERGIALAPVFFQSCVLQKAEQSIQNWSADEGGSVDLVYICDVGSKSQWASAKQISTISKSMHDMQMGAIRNLK